MPKNKALKAVLAENVLALMKARGLKQHHVAALAKQKGAPIDQTTVGRIARAEIPTTVEKLEALGAGLGVEPWQLLVELVDPNGLPSLAALRDAGERDLLEAYRTAGGDIQALMRSVAALRGDSTPRAAEVIQDRQGSHRFTAQDGAETHTRRTESKGKRHK